MEGTVEIARAITITYQTHRPNGKRQKGFDLDLCNHTVGILVHRDHTMYRVFVGSIFSIFRNMGRDAVIHVCCSLLQCGSNGCIHLL